MFKIESKTFDGEQYYFAFINRASPQTTEVKQLIITKLIEYIVTKKTGVYTGDVLKNIRHWACDIVSMSQLLSPKYNLIRRVKHSEFWINYNPKTALLMEIKQFKKENLKSILGTYQIEVDFDATDEDCDYADQKEMVINQAIRDLSVDIKIKIYKERQIEKKTLEDKAIEDKKKNDELLERKNHEQKILSERICRSIIYGSIDGLFKTTRKVVEVTEIKNDNVSVVEDEPELHSPTHSVGLLNISARIHKDENGCRINITVPVLERKMNFSSLGAIDNYPEVTNKIIDIDRRESSINSECTNNFHITMEDNILNIDIFDTTQFELARKKLKKPRAKLLWDDSNWIPGEKKIRDKQVVFMYFIFEGFMKPIWIEFDYNGMKYVFSSRPVNINIDMISVARKCILSYYHEVDIRYDRWERFCKRFGDHRRIDGIYNSYGDIIYVL